MRKLVWLGLLTLGAWTHGQVLYSGFHASTVSFGLHLGYEEGLWGGCIGLPLPIEALAYARRTLDGLGSSWRFGLGGAVYASGTSYQAYLRGLVGYEWRLAPKTGLYLEWGPGLLLAHRSPPPGQGASLLPLLALFRADIGLNLYF